MRRLIILFGLLLSACGQGGEPPATPVNPNIVTSVEVVAANPYFPHLRVTTAAKVYDVEFATCPANVGDTVTEVDSEVAGITDVLVNGEILDYIVHDDFWALNDLIPDEPMKDWGW